MSQKEKSSLIQMLNTSIGNLSGLFKSKKEEVDLEVETEGIHLSEDKQESEDKNQQSLLLNEEEDFEREISQISLCQAIPDSTPIQTEEESLSEEPNNEVLRLKRILTLKEEIRYREKEREKEAVELKVLELIKVEAQLEYERKQRKILELEISGLKKRLEGSELECMELVKYCKLLLEGREGK
ncbi:hypothetical protein NEHOM01_1275 [Nematocida homosporus]|uniref:uncharacterized protein n=1 Tax=Nematocida homosporus TaxID=1912981 RepID=UPI00221FC9BD|nr:uncharacterized protein NEHOM01_1275 [Nematocida homosporus]KAI5186093.1 hypothetical protein NEHOM01_1275 [Nematocida homosporus]